MIQMMRRQICDVCKKEVQDFSGLLKLEYADVDYTGCASPVKLERKEICLNCCRRLAKLIAEDLKEIEDDPS